MRHQKSNQSLSENDTSADGAAASMKRASMGGSPDLAQLEISEGILVLQVQSLTPIVQKQILYNF